MTDEPSGCEWCALYGPEHCGAHSYGGDGWQRPRGALRRPGAPNAAAGQLDAFAGRDVRRPARQGELFGGDGGAA